MATINGDNGPNTLNGTVEDDVINGFGGKDTINGNEGNDDIRPGDGDDDVDGGEGDDLVRNSEGDDLIDGGVGNDYIYDTLGANEIDGGDGSDVIVTNTQYASLIGGEGFDRATLIGSDDVTIDTHAAGIEWIRTGSGHDHIDGGNMTVRLIANGNEGDDWIRGGGNRDLLYGAEGDDELIGLGGMDLLVGGTGNDKLFGGDQDDWLIGGEGSDLLNGGDGMDTASYADAATGVSVNLWLEGRLQDTGGGGMDTLVSIEQVIGSAHQDTLIGNDQDNYLNGGGGDDLMIGGEGDDTYTVDSLNDQVQEYEGEGTDTVQAFASYRMGDNVENVNVMGTAGYAVIGNGLDNMVWGNAGSNTLLGGAGNDSLYGMEGDDVLVGHAGEDLLVGDSGNDRLFGALDNDELYGGLGDDNLRGDEGDDVLVGNEGDDYLGGDEGNDWLVGGSGQNILRGDAGADAFVFLDGDLGGETEATADVIIDFNRGEGDRILLKSLDADTGDDEDDAFTFVGSNAFSNTAGELRYEEMGGNTYVMGDQDGDGTADFMFRLDGSHTVQSGDFVL